MGASSIAKRITIALDPHMQIFIRLAEERQRLKIENTGELDYHIGYNCADALPPQLEQSSCGYYLKRLPKDGGVVFRED